MANIKLSQPRSLDEAVMLLSKDGDQTKIIAGGTALVIMLKNRLISPSVLLSLGGLNDFRYIRHQPGTGLRIGGLVTIPEAETSFLCLDKQPTLAGTFGKVGKVSRPNP